jgi:1,4-alpha-glucan branching enzyme
MYYYDENFMLPLSHDEVVHGKSPMIYKMPGDEWQKFANLRVLYTYMFTHPGGKLLFMGNEFGATTEWNYKTELPWSLLKHAPHNGMKNCVRDLCFLLRKEPALYQKQFDIEGFEWTELNHRSESVMAYRRKGESRENDVLIILNMTPVVRTDWKISVQGKSHWQVIFNSDDDQYWGTGNHREIVTNINSIDSDNKWYELTLQLPPLSAVVLR